MATTGDAAIRDLIGIKEIVFFAATLWPLQRGAATTASRH